MNEVLNKNPILKRKIFDCFLFFNEIELLDLRLIELNEIVDYFVLVEAKKTYTGIEKELFFEKNKEKFSKYLNKIIHVIIEDLPTDKGAWEAEYFSRNAILQGLTNAGEDDLIILSDIDEIPSSKKIKEFNKDEPHVFQQKLYYYYVNCLQNQLWNGSIITSKKYLNSPQKLRDQRENLPKIQQGGWHFSFLGGPERIIDKIKAYAETETCSELTTNSGFICETINQGKDIFNRSDNYAKKNL